MPKKLNLESPEEQSKRFKRDAQKLIAAGELSLADADLVIQRLLTAPKKGDSNKVK